MPWLVVVLVGHLANAGSFVINKTLLAKEMTHPVVYTAQVGVLSAVVLLLIPFDVHWISSRAMMMGALSGITFAFALFTFFSALRRGETTRVVPLLGALIVLLTIIFSYFLLNEILLPKQWWGVVLLLVGGFIISGEGLGSSKARLDNRTLSFIVVAAISFALSSATLKVVFNEVGVVNGFFWTRIFQVVAVLPLLFLPLVRRSFSSREKQRPPVLFYVGQVLGAVGFLLVAWGIALAPQVSVVNALQGIQYGFLFIVIIALNIWRPGIIREQLTPAIVRQKVFALILLSIGLALV